jgi:hypothetical protein
MKVFACLIAAIAVATVTIAAFVRASPASSTSPAPPIAVVSVDANTADARAITGTTVEVARGVRFVVPPGVTYQRLEKLSITMDYRPGVTVVVGLAIGERMKALDDPVTGIAAIARKTDLRVVSITTDGPDRTLGRMEGARDGHRRIAMLFIVTTPAMRVVAYLTAEDPDPGVDQFVDEIVHGRLLLP